MIPEVWSCWILLTMFKVSFLPDMHSIWSFKHGILSYNTLLHQENSQIHLVLVHFPCTYHNILHPYLMPRFDLFCTLFLYCCLKDLKDPMLCCCYEKQRYIYCEIIHLRKRRSISDQLSWYKKTQISVCTISSMSVLLLAPFSVMLVCFLLCNQHTNQNL